MTQDNRRKGQGAGGKAGFRPESKNGQKRGESGCSTGEQGATEEQASGCGNDNWRCKGKSGLQAEKQKTRHEGQNGKQGARNDR